MTKPPRQPSVIIIGAGIAGLSAGCYSQMNGFQATIFELHDKPGGLCTAWERKGYLFDGCIDWLVGSNPGSPFHRIWLELGALGEKPIPARDEFLRYTSADGRSLVLYTEIDRLERHLMELAPEDTALIEEFTGAIRKLTKMEMPVDNPGFFGLIGLGLRILPVLRVMRKYTRVSAVEFAGRFTNPFLREAFTSLSAGMPDFPLTGLMFPLALMAGGDAGCPLGGSLAFARSIERRYLELGGRLEYKSRVVKILVRENRSIGVRLADGREYLADYVVSAADGHATIFEMLEGKYLDAKIRGYYEGGLPPFPPMIQVSLGVARDFSAEPRTAVFPLPEPVRIAGKLESRLSFKHFCADPGMAPPGKSVLTVTFMTDYEYWRELASDPQRYRAEKESIAAAVIDRLDRHFPGLKGQVEAVDVATPMTYERYTANWRASFEGWLITTKTMGLMFGGGLPKQLPGLANFHMIGQWTVVGGGLPTAAKDGRDVVRKLCRQEGRKFETHNR